MTATPGVQEAQVPDWKREMEFRSHALRFQRDYQDDGEALNRFVEWWFGERRAYARALALAAHVEACHEGCGDKMQLCDKAEAIRSMK